MYKLQAAMYDSKCPICGNVHIIKDELSFDNEDINSRAEHIAKQLYDGKFKGDIDPGMTELVAGKLRDGIIQGFGKDYQDMDYNSPDYKMLENLEENIYRFSAAKNYQQLQDMNTALKDDEGKVRSFEEFKNISNDINLQYNSTWLRSEYNTAINSATMAARWVEFKDNPEALLMYQTAGDDRVREEHAALDGTTLPQDDPFWDEYYPPCDWNCRCTVVQVNDGTEYVPNDNELPEINPLFEGNQAEEGVVFKENMHPYFDGVPKKVFKEAEALIPYHDFEEAQKYGKHKESWIEYNKLSKDYQKKYFNKRTGGYVAVHNGHGKDELKQNYKTAKKLADKGYRIELLPKEKGKKTADALINKMKWEFKSIQGAKNNSISTAIQNHFDRGLGQSPNILMHIDQKFKLPTLFEGLEHGIKNDTDHYYEKVILFTNNNIKQVSVKDIISGKYKEILKDFK